MAKRIFVGGLPYATTEQELTELFASVGNVNEAVIITDRMTGQSKGFGFVEMENDADADAAIRNLNETLLGGRTLKVNEANARPPRSTNDRSAVSSERW